MRPGRPTWPRLVLLLLAALLAGPAAASLKPAPPRKVVLLDGTWQVEQGSMDQTPKAFSHNVVVPGLLDMARPAFTEVGKKSPLRQAFWYRRTFKVEGPAPDGAVLKIHKARYGAKVFLNGQMVGEHLPCFTPAYLDVKKHLKGDGQENELVIRVGANRESIPQDMPTGWDFEKYLYIPGIYDSVELILTGTPYIANVQIVPDVDAKAVRVVAEVQSDKPMAIPVNVRVVEAQSGKQAGLQKIGIEFPDGQRERKLDLTIPIGNCGLWSPEDPFLYEVQLSTADAANSGDAVKVRFGMRSFGFRPGDKRAFLNGKPYFMRGTNVCIYRFFEDAGRADLPWRADWVRRLHRQFKWMHWNSIRYCIGFPPEMWYDIADEEGFLIQDEFPIWLLGKAPENPKAEKIIPEYTEWMRERWNHPCVVIWDAQNESFTGETGKALQAVRRLDLSNRPWENGWAEPQSPTDCVESHPYLFIRTWSGQKPFRLKEMPTISGVPALNDRQKKLDVPIIINEYCWLWLNRDGSPTCLTDKVYEGILGPNSTVAQRRTMHARYVAALTEFWRCHRACAGVLHFCGLGYSRSGDKPRPEGGATSDHFLDLQELTFEPLFAQYVREAFNPVGLMLDFWAEEVPCGARQPLRVFVVNDLYRDWSGTVRLRVVRGQKEVSAQSQPCKVPSLGREILSFTETVPAEPGDYTMIAQILDPSGKPVRSLRDFRAKK
jgi:beta-galactosidase